MVFYNEILQMEFNNDSILLNGFFFTGINWYLTIFMFVFLCRTI